MTGINPHIPGQHESCCGKPRERNGCAGGAYMAPEQARDTSQATTASDVCSLGATMLFAWE